MLRTSSCQILPALVSSCQLPPVHRALNFPPGSFPKQRTRSFVRQNYSYLEMPHPPSKVTIVTLLSDRGPKKMAHPRFSLPPRRPHHRPPAGHDTVIDRILTAGEENKSLNSRVHQLPHYTENPALSFWPLEVKVSFLSLDISSFLLRQSINSLKCP